MKFLDKEHEPLRRWLYGALATVAGVLVVYGVVSETEVVAWMAVLEAVLVVPAVETARAAVRPNRSNRDSGDSSSDN